MNILQQWLRYLLLEQCRGLFVARGPGSDLGAATRAVHLRCPSGGRAPPSTTASSWFLGCPNTCVNNIYETLPKMAYITRPIRRYNTDFGRDINWRHLQWLNTAIALQLFQTCRWASCLYTIQFWNQLIIYQNYLYDCNDLRTSSAASNS
jgi:hypothetical protein